MNKAIIIGASSGIGKELAKVMAEKGYVVGLAARRLDLLTELQQTLPVRSYAKHVDVAHTAEAMDSLKELIDEMNGVDVVIISSAVAFYNPDIDWNGEFNTLEVNVLGVTAMANVAFNYFSEHGGGHIVGISSFKALRGGGNSPAYNASKAFLSNYLEGLRINSNRLGKNVVITDVRPGLVDSSLANRSTSFLVAPAQEVALQIYETIVNKESVAYVPRRYKFIGYALRNMPFCIYSKLKR